MMTSKAESPVFGGFSTGIPRPLSRTVAEPSSFRVTQISVASPANASSTELSMISVSKWWNPLASVEPIYIPGRFRTGSKPSNSWMSCAVYVDFGLTAITIEHLILLFFELVCKEKRAKKKAPGHVFDFHLSMNTCQGQHFRLYCLKIKLPARN